MCPRLRIWMALRCCCTTLRRVTGAVSAQGMIITLLVALASVAVSAEELLPTLTEAKVTVGEPATLVVANRHIVELRAQIGAMTPERRVEGIERRIANLPLDTPADKIGMQPGTMGRLSGYWIDVDGQRLLGLANEDLDPDSDQTLEQLAKQTVVQLREALRARSDQQRLPVLLRAAVFTLLATALFVLVLWGVGLLRSRSLQALAKRSMVRPVEVRGINLRPYLRAFEEGAIKLTAFGSGLVAAYLWLTFILLQFPYSYPWGEGLGKWLGGMISNLGLGVLHAIPGFFTVIIIFLATRLIVQVVDRFFRSVEAGWLRVRWLEAETARATRRLAIVLIWIFAVTVAFPYIPGSHSDAFKGVSVLVGLMISLGSAGFVNQLMSGLVIVYARAFKTGEFVQVADSEGTITEVGMLSTKLVTPFQREITIPNAVLVTSKVTNYSRLATAATGAIVTTEVTIGYDTPWRQVHAMLQMAAERTTLVRQEPKPVVIQTALSDFYVGYQLLVNIDAPENKRKVLSALHANIQDVFNEYGVQIMSPNFEDQPPEKVYVPKDAWFTAPAKAPENESQRANRV